MFKTARAIHMKEMLSILPELACRRGKRWGNAIWSALTESPVDCYWVKPSCGLLLSDDWRHLKLKFRTHKETWTQVHGSFQLSNIFDMFKFALYDWRIDKGNCIKNLNEKLCYIKKGPHSPTSYKYQPCRDAPKLSPLPPSHFALGTLSIHINLFCNCSSFCNI